MAAATLFQHIVSYFCARRGTRRIQWLDMYRDMQSLVAGMPPAERRQLAYVLRQLYRYASNENYYSVNNGEYWLIRRLAPRLSCAFDVGAHVGNWTTEFLANSPVAIVHAFEPVPDVFAKLNNRLAGNARVRLNDFGMLDREGMFDLNVVPGDSQRSSIFSLDAPTEAVVCSFTTGDSYVERARVSNIDFLKIDCEGAEPKVLAGFDRTLQSGAVTIIQLEYGPLNIQSRWLLRDMHGQLRGLGYRVGRLYPSYVDFKEYEIDDETFFGGNFVACLEARSDLIGMMSA